MPNTAQGETQQIRLTRIPVETVRKIKSEAALVGATLDEYLTDWIVREFVNEIAESEKREG